MDIAGKTALVTGANRGLGRQLAAQLRDRGARVYAAARNPGAVDLTGVTPLALDITDPAAVQAAAEATGDVAILVNNACPHRGRAADRGPGRHPAGAGHPFPRHAGRDPGLALPQLAAQGASAVLNVLSVLSWLSLPQSGAYCAAKSAEWSLTNALRQELASQGTQVTALHVGYMDTDMVRRLDVPKSDPAVIAKLAIDGLAAGDVEVIADEDQQACPGRALRRGRRPLPAVRLTGPAHPRGPGASRRAVASRFRLPVTPGLCSSPRSC